MSPKRPITKFLGTGIVRQLFGLPQAFNLSDLERGTQLYTPGDAADRLFFLDLGRVKISVPAQGGKQCILRVVEPGEVFGECALFDDPVRKAAAEVIENSSIKVVPRNAVLDYAERHPDFWESYSKHLGRRVRDLQQQVEWVTFFEVEERIARLLLRWSETHRSNGEDGSRLQLSQRDVAGLVGATRETTSAALNRLQRDGCISIRRRCLVVESPERLARHAKVSKAQPLRPSADAAAARGHAAGD